MSNHTTADGVKYHYTYYQKAQGNGELCLELQQKAGVAVQEADSKYKAELQKWEAVTREREIVERSRELHKADKKRPIIVSSNPLVNSKEPPARPVPPPTNRVASPTPTALVPSNKKHFEEPLEDRTFSPTFFLFSFLLFFFSDNSFLCN